MTTINGYRKIRLSHLSKINLIFNKQNKNLTKEEKQALKLLKKFENSELELEITRIYSELMSCLDTIEQSKDLLKEIEKILSIKKSQL